MWNISTTNNAQTTSLMLPCPSWIDLVVPIFHIEPQECYQYVQFCFFQARRAHNNKWSLKTKHKEREIMHLQYVSMTSLNTNSSTYFLYLKLLLRVYTCTWSSIHWASLISIFLHISSRTLQAIFFLRGCISIEETIVFMP